MILFPTKKATRHNRFVSQTYDDGSDVYPERYGTASHAAVDIASGHGDPMMACERLFAYKTFGGQDRDIPTGLTKGWGINLLSEPNIDGVRREWIYWHTMSNLQIKEGQWAEMGQIIAFEGASGDVYSNGVKVPDDQKGIFPYPGTHLHWGYREVRPVDQGEYCIGNGNGGAYRDQNGKAYEVIDYNNGNKGFKDPMKLNVLFYDEWVVEKAKDVVEETIEIIPTLPEEKKIATQNILITLLKMLVNFLKGRQ